MHYNIGLIHKFVLFLVSIQFQSLLITTLLFKIGEFFFRCGIEKLTDHWETIINNLFIKKKLSIHFKNMNKILIY